MSGTCRCAIISDPLPLCIGRKQSLAPIDPFLESIEPALPRRKFLSVCIANILPHVFFHLPRATRKEVLDLWNRKITKGGPLAKREKWPPRKVAIARE